MPGNINLDPKNTTFEAMLRQLDAMVNSVNVEVQALDFDNVEGLQSKVADEQRADVKEIEAWKAKVGGFLGIGGNAQAKEKVKQYTAEAELGYLFHTYLDVLQEEVTAYRKHFGQRNLGRTYDLWEQDIRRAEQAPTAVRKTRLAGVLKRLGAEISKEAEFADGLRERVNKADRQVGLFDRRELKDRMSDLRRRFDEKVQAEVRAERDLFERGKSKLHSLIRADLGRTNAHYRSYARKIPSLTRADKAAADMMTPLAAADRCVEQAKDAAERYRSLGAQLRRPPEGYTSADIRTAREEAKDAIEENLEAAQRHLMSAARETDGYGRALQKAGIHGAAPDIHFDPEIFDIDPEDFGGNMRSLDLKLEHAEHHVSEWVEQVQRQAQTITTQLSDAQGAMSRMEQAEMQRLLG